MLRFLLLSVIYVAVSNAQEEDRSPPVLQGLVCQLHADVWDEGREWKDISGQDSHALTMDPKRPPKKFEVKGYYGKNFGTVRLRDEAGGFWIKKLKNLKKYTIFFVGRHQEKGLCVTQARAEKFCLGFDAQAKENTCVDGKDYVSFGSSKKAKMPENKGVFAVYTAMRGKSPEAILEEKASKTASKTSFLEVAAEVSTETQVEVVKKREVWRGMATKGNLGSETMTAAAANLLFAKQGTQIIKRMCSKCSEHHKEIYYRRKSPLNGFNVFDAMTSNWKSANNKMGEDFDLYSTLRDAISDKKAWKFCNYDDPGVGFPRDCGPTKAVGGQWNSWSGKGGQADVAFSIYIGSPLQEVAKGKKATSTVWGWGGAPARAVDGNTKQQWKDGSCTHTQWRNKAFWKVDLGENFIIGEVKLWNRADCCGDRLKNIQVGVTETAAVPYTDKHKFCIAPDREALGQKGSLGIFECRQLYGRYVSVFHQGGGVVTLCEVKVYANVGGCSGLSLAKGTFDDPRGHKWRLVREGCAFNLLRGQVHIGGVFELEGKTWKAKAHISGKTPVIVTVNNEDQFSTSDGNKYVRECSPMSIKASRWKQKSGQEWRFRLTNCQLRMQSGSKVVQTTFKYVKGRYEAVPVINGRQVKMIFVNIERIDTNTGDRFEKLRDSATDVRFWYNGMFRGQANFEPLATVSIGQAAFGTWGEHNAGDIAQMLVYNRVLSLQEKREVEWWIKGQYGVKIHTNDACRNNGGCHPLVPCAVDKFTVTCGKCPKGFSGNGKGSYGCKDIDECKVKNGGCDKLTTCTNTVGSFTCGNCPKGFTGSGLAGCVDIDECGLNNGGCDYRTKCINTPGSRKCGPCIPGYIGSGLTGCKDLNECLKKNGGCDDLTMCKNTIGSFECGDCPYGYTGTGLTGCTDIDECAHVNGGCDRLSECTNLKGGRTCGKCPKGYLGDGERGCMDINECLEKNGGCHTLSTCVNTRGSRMCGPCPAGYAGDGSFCDDIDECSVNNGDCDPLSICTNTPGAFTCGPCPLGWEGDGNTGCDKIAEKKAAETVEAMTERVAAEEASKKAQELEAEHAEALKDQILKDARKEKEATMRRLAAEAAKLAEENEKELKSEKKDAALEKALNIQKRRNKMLTLADRASQSSYFAAQKILNQMNAVTDNNNILQS